MAVGEFIHDYRLRRSDTNIQTFPFFAIHFRQAQPWAARLAWIFSEVSHLCRTSARDS